jgi:hypothetical protein
MKRGSWDLAEVILNYDTRTILLDSIQARLRFCEKSLGVQSIRHSSHHNSNEPANVESCLDKIRVVG